MYALGMDTIKSGLPRCHLSASENFRLAGMSAGLPSGEPPSTHAVIVAISASVSEGSFLNLLTPTFLSICQGGMVRLTTLSLMERAHGRASFHVSSDIGAIEPGRWQFSQAFWKIGATSFVNVGVAPNASDDTTRRVERTLLTILNSYCPPSDNAAGCF